MREQLEWMELCLGMEEEPTGSFWFRIKGGIKVGVFYRPPDQEEQVDCDLYRQMGKQPHSQSLVLMGDFNHVDYLLEGQHSQIKALQEVPGEL